MLLAALLLLLSPAIAAADPIIFNGGAPDQQSGNEMTHWVQTEDFQLTTAKRLTDGHFWTLEGFGTPFGGNAWDGTLQWYLFADNGGQPAAAPFATGLGQNIVRTFVGAGPFGLDEYQYSFDLLNPVELAGGTTYWFGLHLAADFQNRDEIYWETTNLAFGAFGSTGQESFGGTFDNWFNNEQHHAFFLTGTEVPEPASLMLCGLVGAGLVGYRLRRKTKVVA